MKHVQKFLLICGILSTILYIATDIFVGLNWHGYSFASQAISELSAIGAPTRSLWIAMTTPFSLLVTAFGVGAWIAAGSKRSLQITGILLTIWGISGYAWYFFPMHMRGAIGSTTDTMHLVLSAFTVLILVLFVGFGSGAGGKWFRIYSILTIVAMLFFGAVVGQQAPRVAAELPTPWMGIEERISVYAPMIWVIVFAGILLRVKKKINV